MAEQTPDSIITTQRNGQTIVAELFFNHSSTLSTIATPKKISQRVASAFRLRFRPFSSMHPSLVDACYTPDGRVRFDGVPARRLACVGITRRTRSDTCR